MRKPIEEVPSANIVLLPGSNDADDLVSEYLRRGVVGPGSRADAQHVALATVAQADILVSWNFKHIVNVGRIRRFHAVNIELGYGTPEIRTPVEVLDYEQGLRCSWLDARAEKPY